MSYFYDYKEKIHSKQIIPTSSFTFMYANKNT